MEPRHKALARVLRAVLEPFHPGLFRPPFQWQADDSLPPDLSPPYVIVQTHLQGMPTKKWSTQAWRKVLQGIRRLLPAQQLVVLDPAGQPLQRDADLLLDTLSFVQALRVTEGASFLLSVDSWTKYPAAWMRIPQVIIVPDQTPDYPQLTDEQVRLRVDQVIESDIRFAEQGYTILLIGHEGHDEVAGTMGEAPEAIILVETPEDVDRLEIADTSKLAYLTQTTLSVDDTAEIVAVLRRRFPAIQVPRSDRRANSCRSPAA